MIKPKIYAPCKAGCEWETVHKDDFLKSASIVKVAEGDGSSGVIFKMPLPEKRGTFKIFNSAGKHKGLYNVTIRYADSTSDDKHNDIGAAIPENKDYSILEICPCGVGYTVFFDGEVYNAGNTKSYEVKDGSMVVEIELFTEIYRINSEAEIMLENEHSKWKLLGETEITQEMINEAGDAGITAVVLDLGEAVEKWYSDTLIRVEFNAKDVSEDSPIFCQFGATIEEVIVKNDAISNTYIIRSQSKSYAPIVKGFDNIINLATRWIDGKPYGTIYENSMYNAVCYPYMAYATSSTNQNTIFGKRYLMFSSWQSDVKFPVGTVLKLYGRF